MLAIEIDIERRLAHNGQEEEVHSTSPRYNALEEI
jgi:hypothetical protein